jgi:hypothetical protein
VKAREAFGQLFAKSSTLHCVAIVQRAVRKAGPAALMAKYGFGELELVSTVQGVHMSGASTLALFCVHHGPAALSCAKGAVLHKVVYMACLNTNS